MEESTSYNSLQSYFKTLNVRVYLLIVLVTVLYIRYTRNKRTYNNLPPGPPCLPLLGSIPWINRSNPAKSMIEWADKYGDVVTYYIGSRRYIAVSDAKLARELLVKRGGVFAARGDVPGGQNSWGIKGGVFFENGDDWKTHRRWIMTGLRHFGMGKSSLHEQLNTEAKKLCQEIRKYQGKFNPYECVSNAVSNIICSLSFGKRYEYDDPDFQNLLKNVSDIFNYTHMGRLEEVLPFMMRFFISRQQQVDSVIQFFNSHMQYHKETFDENNIRDLIDMLLLQVKEDAEAAEKETSTKREPGKTTYKGGKMVSDDVDCLWRSIMMLFLAGTDTTTSTILWFLLFIISYPDVQKRVQDEIDAATEGGKRPLTQLDKLKVPYFEATILEVQRLCNIAAVLVPHRTSEDSVVNGYDIPANTNVTFTLKYIHTDSKYWKDPLVFRPERFMDADETTLRKSDYFMPYGLGRRSCAGEMLAKMEIYEFTSCLLQRFVFEIPESSPRPSFDPIIGITQSPRPFELVAKPRPTPFD